MGITITSIDSSLNALIVNWSKDADEPSDNKYTYKFNKDATKPEGSATLPYFVIETANARTVYIVATDSSNNTVVYGDNDERFPYLKGSVPLFSVSPVSGTSDTIEVRYADASYAGYPSLSKYKYTVTPITSNTKTLRQYNVGNGTRSLQNMVFWSALDDLPSIVAITEPENNEVIAQYSAGIEMFSGETMTGLLSDNFNTFSSRSAIEGEKNVNSDRNFRISGLESNTNYEVTVQGVGTVVGTVGTTAAWISDPATQTVTTNQIETTPPKIVMKSLFTDNSKIFYKPGSLSCGVGSTKNYRHKSKHT